MKQKKSASILIKFLLFNLLVFSVLGLLTFIYLQAIQPSLVKKKSSNHLVIIKNTTDHLQRLKIDFNEKGLSTFLLSTRFLFQSLDRVQFFSLDGDLIGDTNTLDLDQNVFSKSDLIIEQEINNPDINQTLNIDTSIVNNELKYYKKIKNTVLNKLKNEAFVIESKVKKDFFVQTLDKVLIDKKKSDIFLLANNPMRYW